MATAKISSTKSTSRAINYAEKRAEEKSGLNCDIDYAKGSFKATRELYGKTGGNEGHVVIQSFKSGEVTPAQCNQLGMELAEKIAPNHQDKKKLVFNSFLKYKNTSHNNQSYCTNDRHSSKIKTFFIIPFFLIFTYNFINFRPT